MHGLLPPAHGRGSGGGMLAPPSPLQGASQRATVLPCSLGGWGCCVWNRSSGEMVYGARDPLFHLLTWILDKCTSLQSQFPRSVKWGR